MRVLDLDDDDPAFQWIIGHDGRPTQILRDKHSFRVSMSMRDADSVRGAIAASRARITDGAGNGELALCRPGSRLLSDEGFYDESSRARAQGIADASQAWRRGPARDTRPPLNAFGPFEANRVGQPCTLDGQPGVLERSGDWLVCNTASADARRKKTQARDPFGREAGTFEEETSSDAAPVSVGDAERIKAAARDEAAREQAEAWRGLRSA